MSRRRTPIYADLHVHTTNSDGQLPLSRVPAAARRAGLRAVAITDHDRLHPDLDGPVVERHGVTLVHGIELQVDACQSIDLIGYGARETPALRAEVDRLAEDREERGSRILERVEELLGIDLDVDPRPGLGRPHIARAIAAHPDSGYDYQGAFDDLIGDDRPCYVARAIPSLERGRKLLEEACALVGLAHPLRYDDPAAALDIAGDLDAVERWYPYGPDVDRGLVREVIDRYGLIATGGSDAHDAHLGRTGLTARAYRAVRRGLDRDR